MGAETPLGRWSWGLSKRKPAKRKPGNFQVEGRQRLTEEPGGRPGVGRARPRGSSGRVGLCSGALHEPLELSRQERFWLSQARGRGEVGQKGAAPPMGSALNHAPLRLGPRPVGPWAAEGAPAPDPPFFLADPSGHAQRYVLGKGGQGPGALWWQTGWQTGKGCL